MLPVIKKFSKLLPNFTLPNIPELTDNVYLGGTLELYILDDSPAEDALGMPNISVESFGALNLLEYVSKTPKEEYFKADIKLLGGLSYSVTNIYSWVISLQSEYNQNYLPNKLDLENRLSVLENVLLNLSNIDPLTSADSYSTTVDQANNVIDSCSSIIDRLSLSLDRFSSILPELEAVAKGIEAINEYGSTDPDSSSSTINNLIGVYNQFFQDG